MSEGPIKRWRDGFAVEAPAKVTANSVHGYGRDRGVYCGRNGRMFTLDWKAVTCVDCLAAYRADHADRRAGE